MNINKGEEERPGTGDSLGLGKSQDSVAPEAEDSIFNQQESAESIQEPEDINEHCILFHVVCGDQVGEEFLVHADCSVGVMMDFIKRRLMEDMSLPEDSCIELFDDKGKSLKIHLADPRERGTKFVKQRGVYFPMYFIPEYVPPEFGEQELSQNSEDESEFDDLFTGKSTGEYFLTSDEEEELFELHMARRNVSSPRSSSSSEMETLETLQHPYNPYALMTEMPEDGYYNPKGVMAVVPAATGGKNKFEEVFRDFDNLANSYRQEYPGEGETSPLSSPLKPEDAELENSPPDSPDAEDDDYDQLMREYQDEELGGEGYEYNDIDNKFILPPRNLQKVPSEIKNKEAISLRMSQRKENLNSDSTSYTDISKRSKSSSSDEIEALTPVVASDKKNKKKDVNSDLESDNQIQNVPSRSKGKSLVYPRGFVVPNLRTFSEHSLQKISSEIHTMDPAITGINSVEHPSHSHSTHPHHPPKKHEHGNKTVFVPIIAGTFDGCVKICQWVVDLHGEIDRGVKDMEHMINEAVASQETQFVDTNKSNKRSGQKDKKKYSVFADNKGKHGKTQKKPNDVGSNGGLKDSANNIDSNNTSEQKESPGPIAVN